MKLSIRGILTDASEAVDELKAIKAEKNMKLTSEDRAAIRNTLREFEPLYNRLKSL